MCVECKQIILKLTLDSYKLAPILILLKCNGPHFILTYFNCNGINGHSIIWNSFMVCITNEFTLHILWCMSFVKCIESPVGDILVRDIISSFINHLLIKSCIINTNIQTSWCTFSTNHLMVLNIRSWGWCQLIQGKPLLRKNQKLRELLKRLLQILVFCSCRTNVSQFGWKLPNNVVLTNNQNTCIQQFPHSTYHN